MISDHIFSPAGNNDVQWPKSAMVLSYIYIWTLHFGRMWCLFARYSPYVHLICRIVFIFFQYDWDISQAVNGVTCLGLKMAQANPPQNWQVFLLKSPLSPGQSRLKSLSPWHSHAVTMAMKYLGAYLMAVLGGKARITRRIVKCLICFHTYTQITKPVQYLNLVHMNVLFYNLLFF